MNHVESVLCILAFFGSKLCCVIFDSLKQIQYCQKDVYKQKHQDTQQLPRQQRQQRK